MVRVLLSALVALKVDIIEEAHVRLLVERNPDCLSGAELQVVVQEIHSAKTLANGGRACKKKEPSGNA